VSATPPRYGSEPRGVGAKGLYFRQNSAFESRSPPLHGAFIFGNVRADLRPKRDFRGGARFPSGPA